MISIIFAIDQNGLIGSSDGKYGLPWHYPEDLKFYQKMTTNKKCIMGRKTYEAIGKALPNRETFVVTRQKKMAIPNVTIVDDLDNIIQHYHKSEEEIMIVGGTEIINYFWDYATKIYITLIHEEHTGDKYLTNLNFNNLKITSKKFSDDHVLEFQVWEKND